VGKYFEKEDLILDGMVTMIEKQNKNRSHEKN